MPNNEKIMPASTHVAKTAQQNTDFVPTAEELRVFKLHKLLKKYMMLIIDEEGSSYYGWARSGDFTAEELKILTNIEAEIETEKINAERDSIAYHPIDEITHPYDRTWYHDHDKDALKLVDIIEAGKVGVFEKSGSHRELIRYPFLQMRAI